MACPRHKLRAESRIPAAVALEKQEPSMPQSRGEYVVRKPVEPRREAKLLRSTATITHDVVVLRLTIVITLRESGEHSN